uniref:Protein Vpu n=1 Tax=Human immunodeficiency virus type 1 TaxID=11676 RepID=B3UEK3_HV1|nr:vpu protein [Human immunodeficiency virus 1]ACE67061.1 vpu protein [Human immunodeficiency virus 1]ACE67063.1 vpu protein [Human immunodeficiency virus 1]ACE67065.1 vpu protein [Human immunodeficiency virus 1]ACE67067.1 vpu protein [Human immunodeficiency virus 1]
MQTLVVVVILAFIVTIIIAIVVWSIVFIEYRKILKQRKIDKLLARIAERAEDSGNESEGDQEELSALEMGRLVHWNVDDL